MPLSVMLVVVLTISGAGFMHHDYLERLMTMRNVDNQGSFYLANAGLERERETFKVPDDFTWTLVLAGSWDGDADGNPDYPRDDDASDQFDTLLCPIRPCVIPSFQAPSGAPLTSGMPFDATSTSSFDDGLYSARAFNDVGTPGETATQDLNGILVYRALGSIRGELKLLELQAQAISGLDLINCRQDDPDGPEEPCPDRVDGTKRIDPAEGREPSSHPELPSLIDPLNDPDQFYRFDLRPGNFKVPGPPLSVVTCGGSGGKGKKGGGGGSTVDCSTGKLTLDVQNNTFYFLNQAGLEVKVRTNGPKDRVIVYALGGATGDVVMENNHQLSNAIIIGQGEIQLKDGVLRAPLGDDVPHYPAIIAEGNVTAGNADVQVFGNVFATKDPIPDGIINANPVDFHGMLIGDRVEVQGSSTYTDDHATDPDWLRYYSFMEGFRYPKSTKTNETIAGTWRELQ